MPSANLCKVCKDLEIKKIILKPSLLLQTAEVAPAGLEFAVVAVLDEFGQEMLGVVFAGGVVVVLDAVYFDAAVVVRGGLEERPGLFIGPKSVQDPVLEDEAGRVQRRCNGQPGGGHFSRAHEAAAAYEVMLAPVTSLPPRGEVLDGFAVVDAFHGAVYPAEAQRHLHGVYVADHAGTVGRCPVHPQPEILCRRVMLHVPRVQLLAGVYVQQVGDFHHHKDKP